MKNIFIFLSVFVIFLIAIFDIKDRLKELDEISANTPSQVELQQMIHKPVEQMKRDNIQNQNNEQSLKEKSSQDNKPTQQNQLYNVDKRRNTINNEMK
jgi:hypothetical protein